MPQPSAASSAPSASREPAPSLPRPVAARLRAHARLGAATWSAERVADAQPWLLRIVSLPPGDDGAAALEGFERDQRRLARLGDGAASPFTTITAADGRLYLERRRVPGVPATGAARPCPIRLAIHVGLEVARTLAAAHAQQVLHRGLKPSNVLLDEPAADDVRPRVHVVDWGLGRFTPGPTADDEGDCGRFAYLAPEQSGRLEHAVDGRADLWALGVLLYELVSGQPPFSGREAEAVARATVTTEPPDLDALRPETPPALGALVRRLLAKEPRRRYGTAAALAHDLGALARALEAGGTADVPLATLDVSAPVRGAALPLVGRDRLLGRLARDLDRAAAGHGAVVLLGGDAGSGRTRLAREVAARARRMGGLALWGHAAATTRAIPYAPIGEALDELAARAGVAPDADRQALRARIERRIGDLAGIVLTLAPALGDLVPAPAPLAPLPADRAAFRCREALARLLGALGREGHPLVLVLEGLEHADAATVRLLEHLGAGALEGAPLLVLGTMGPEVPDQPRARVRDLVGGRRLELGPLDGADARRLVRELVGDDGAEGAARGEELLAREVAPLPGRLVLGAMRAEAAAQGLAPEWTVGLARDAPGEHELVAALALAAVPLPPELLATALGRDERALVAELSCLAERGAVTWYGPSSARRAACTSGAVAAAAVERLPDRGATLRARLAATLERVGEDGARRWRALAFALHAAAGAAAGTSALGALVARDALDLEAPDEALDVVRLLRSLTPHPRPDDEVLEAEALERLGRTREALVHYRRFLDAPPTPSEVGATTAPARARITERAAALLAETVSTEAALALLAPELRAAGVPLPTTALGARAVHAGARMTQAVQRLNDSKALTSVRARHRARAERAVRLLDLAARVLAASEPLRAEGARLRALNRATQLGLTEGTFELLEAEACRWGARGALGRAAQLARRALTERERSGTVSAVAPAHLVLGRLLATGGRLGEALSHLEEAVRGFDEQGDLGGETDALETLGSALAERGDWHRAIEVWERTQATARRLGSDAGVTRALARLALAYARVGDERHAVELVAIEAAPGVEPAVVAARDLWVGQALVALGRPAQGELLLARAAAALPFDARAPSALATELVAADAEALVVRLGSETQPPADGPVSLALTLRRLRAGAARWPLVRPRALRLEAQAHRAEVLPDAPDGRGWWTAVQRSLDAARTIGARWEEATTLLEAAAGLETRGDPRARAYRVRAERLLEQGSPAVVVPLAGAHAPAAPTATSGTGGSGAAPPRKDGTQRLRLPTPVPSRVPEVLAERRRWKSLLELNGALSSILDASVLLERVVELGLEVTSAQRGFLLLLEAEPDAAGGLGPVPDGVRADRVAGRWLNLKVARHAGGERDARGFGGSRSVVHQVLLTGRSVLSGDARNDPAFGKLGSVAAQQIRSVLAVPLVRKDRVLGVLYVDNPLVAGLIRERERELLEVFATQAATALDNARAYGEIAALERRLSSENVRLRETLRASTRPGAIIGESPGIKRALEQVARVAPTDSTVLLLGETGVGKEGFARAVHELSRRRDGPLVKIDCAALPATLLESELFGHERGAFTGAERRRIGKFEMAQGGTVFLDEIGNVPLDLQVKLLQVLQSRTFFRVGGREAIEVDVRLVAATNRDLALAVREGQFREDLYYRLHVVPIRVPPLRERPGDVPLLVRHFVERFNRALGRDVRVLPEPVLEVLARHPWPGNVRELENVIERALVLADGPVLELAGFPPAGAGPVTASPEAVAGSDEGGDGDEIPLAEGVRRYKQARIDRALARTGGNRAEASRLLGIHRQNLGRLLKQLASGAETTDE